ncbi:hypothetical protein MBLNU13_g01342t1 [Cladosporium sp. NU13]
MTCVLASPWNPLSTNVSWSSMNQNLPDSSYSGLERTQSHGYASSGSEQPKKSGSTTKKRASRAGTRSVSTLSAAQLERKRANDREAQRAIRQRTKDHIDGLESTITELRRSQEASDKISLATRQRNRELEEENSYLRLRLSEAGLTADLPPQISRPQDSTLTVTQNSSPGPHAAGASIQRPASTSTSRSFSGTHPGPSGSWQTQHAPRGSYVGLTNLPLAVPGSATSQPQAGLTTWRSHESTQSVPSVPQDVHTPARNASSLPYNGPLNPDRQHWPSTTPQYQYTVTEQQPQYQTHPQAPAQQHSPYSQAPVHTYPPVQHAQQQQQQPAYHPPQMPPQSEFQNLSVSSSTSPYTVPAPVSQGFVPQQQYHFAPMQPTEYSQSQSQLPAQSLPPPTYHQASSEQPYQPPPPPQQQQAQQQQSSVHYRDDSGRAYPVGHYPPA